VSDPAITGPGRSPRFLLVAVAAVGVAVAGGWAVGKFRTARPDPAPPDPVAVVPPPAPDPDPDRRGELLFRVHCASCHGPDGRGDGPNAAALRPPPRDFAARPWRFEVTKESIRRVTLDGIPGSSMASFRPALAPAEVEPLVGYVHHLATSRPPVAYEPSEEERLLRAGGFIDLRGVDPPPLTVTDAAGKDVRLADLKGRLVLVHFWATNCAHCLKEMPRLRELEAALAGRGLTVLHVCTDAEDVGAAQALAGRSAPGVRVFADQSGLGLARFEVQALPTVWLVGPDGRAVGRSHGARDWGDPAVRRLLERWLPAGP
jgi:mono/diheme cytochrome c family protein